MLKLFKIYLDIISVIISIFFYSSWYSDMYGLFFF